MADSKSPQSLPTDTLVVLPVEEKSAIMDALYYTLEKTTTADFGLDVRKNMLAAIKRLD